MRQKKVSDGDIARAKRAVRWDIECGGLGPNFLEYLEGEVNLTETELAEVRGAMRRYEKQEAAFGEDELMYESRFNMQFIETTEK